MSLQCTPSSPSQVWQSLFTVRQLVVPMHEDVDNWLKFSSLCRKSGRSRQSERMLLQLLRWGEGGGEEVEQAPLLPFPPPSQLLSSELSAALRMRVMAPTHKCELPPSSLLCPSQV